ncbi:hypothetical protein pdam_00019274, partial [Pocillopora damicornis]
FTIDSKENDSNQSENIKEESTNVLSEYVKGLESCVKHQYLGKIAAIRIDPALLVVAKLDPECIPLIEAADLLSYLVLETSYYTLKQFKAHKSLEAYNQMISGFITSIQSKIISDKFVVVEKVRHSQGMTEAPLPVWIIASKEGTIISAHCLGCKARLANSCSHVASVLFYVEAWTRINGKLACTQLLPAYVNEVPYSEVKDINFKSARRIRNEMDKEVNGKNSCSASPSSESCSNSNHKKVAKAEMLGYPSVKEINSLLSKLNKDKQKAAILSLIPPYSNHQIPILLDLFDSENIKLTYPDLMKNKVVHKETACSKSYSASTSSGPCYCRTKTQERTIHCSNPECPVKEFHYSCLQVSDPILKI